jgi:hypothetical protein
MRPARAPQMQPDLPPPPPVAGFDRDEYTSRSGGKAAAIREIKVGLCRGVQGGPGTCSVWHAMAQELHDRHACTHYCNNLQHRVCTALRACLVHCPASLPCAMPRPAACGTRLKLRGTWSTAIQ